MYPVSLLFGLPLARRDMEDSRKWLRETATVQPAPVIPAEGVPLAAATQAAFGADAVGVPVSGQERLTTDTDWVQWFGPELQPVAGPVWTLAEPLPETFE